MKISKRIKTKSPRQRMLGDLQASGLSDVDARKLGFEPMTAQQSKRLDLSRAGDGYRIPYHAADRSLIKGTFRYRYFDTTVSSGFLKGQKLRKYDQPAGTQPELYLPHLSGTDWCACEQDTNTALSIVEGEKKAASVTKHVMPCVGIGGVWSAGAQRHGTGLIPALERFKWEGRVVSIIFDSDIHTNPSVRQAANRLARVLSELRARVRVVELPSEDSSDGKLGADDFIAKRGVPALKKLIENAVPWENNRGLLELMGQAIYVQSPSSVAIVEIGQAAIELIPVRVARHERFADKFFIDDNGREKPAFPEWLTRRRRSVKRLAYAPGEDLITRNGELNTWRGWPFEPIAGDITLWGALLDYIFKDATPEFRKWVEQWIAYPIQHPGAKLYTALVLWSRARGTGKTLLGKLIAKLYGIHGIEVNQEVLTCRFNALYAGRTSFVLGAEMLGDDGRKNGDLLKHLITGHTIIVEEKFLPSYEVPNCMNLMLTSNHPLAVYAGDGERRYAVHEITGAPQPDSFYRPFDTWLNSSVAEDRLSPALFHHLRTLDLSGFNPHSRAPHTPALDAMIDAGRTQVESWVHELRVNPEGVPIDVTSLHRRPLSLHTNEELLAMLGRDTRHTPKSLALALNAEGFQRANRGQSVRLSDGKKPRLWIVRDLKRLSRMTETEIARAYDSERKRGAKLLAVDLDGVPSEGQDGKRRKLLSK